MNVEFARLAAARRIVTSRTSTGDLVEDRVNAERWIAQFGHAGNRDVGQAATIIEEPLEHSVILRPSHQNGRLGPAIFYIHGGGMVYYSTAVFRPFLRVLAHELGSPIEAFDYLKAPEHTVEESVERLARYMAARLEETTTRPTIIAGDSVGGLLALFIALRILPRAFTKVVLIYPVLDLVRERESYDEFGKNHFLDRAALNGFRKILRPFFSGRAFDPFSLTDHDLEVMGQPSVVTAGCDVLRDEAFAWSTHLRSRGVRANHIYFPDLPHDFCLYAEKVDAASDAVSEIASAAFHTEGESCP